MRMSLGGKMSKVSSSTFGLNTSIVVMLTEAEAKELLFHLHIAAVNWSSELLDALVAQFDQAGVIADE
jgi:hypothetical protein